MEHLGTQVIESDRLLLRPLKVDDAQEMFENWASSDLATRYVSWEAYTEIQPVIERLRMREEAYPTNEFYDWGIVIKDDNKLVGTIGFVEVSELDKRAELGYIIGPAWWRKGYVAEAAQAVFTFAFEKLGLHRIQAVHDVRNPASGRVMEKLGMQYEGTFRESRMVKGSYVTLKQYAILEKDFKEKKTSK